MLVFGVGVGVVGVGCVGCVVNNFFFKSTILTGVGSRRFGSVMIALLDGGVGVGCWCSCCWR